MTIPIIWTFSRLKNADICVSIFVVLTIAFVGFWLFNEVQGSLGQLGQLVVRDPSHYWVVTLEFSNSQELGNFSQWIYEFLASLKRNHTLVPVLIPFVWSEIFGAPTSTGFGLIVAAFYRLPAVLVFAAVILSFVRGEWLFRVGALTLGIAYICVVVQLPGATSPDAGGLIFIGLSILFFLGAVRVFKKEPTNKTALFLGLNLFLMVSSLLVAVLFRRWYGFAALGMSMAIVVYIVFWVAAEVRSPRPNSKLYLIATGASAVVFFVLFGGLLAGKLEVVLGSGVLGSGFDAYKMNYFRVLTTNAKFPVLIASAFIIGGLLLSLFEVRRSPELVTVFLGSVLGVILFLNVQRLGMHHYALTVVPAIFGSIITLSALRRNTEKYETPISWGVLLLGFFSLPLGAIVTSPNAYPQRLAQQNLALAEYIRAYNFSDRQFCVVANREAFRSIYDNLWQIIDGAEFKNWPRATQVPETNNGLEDGYQFGMFGKCEYLFTLEELTLTSGRKHHKIIAFMHDKLMLRRGPFASYWTQTETVDLGYSSPIMVFRRNPEEPVDIVSVVEEYREWLRTAPLLD